MNSCPLSLWPRPWQLFGPSFFPPPFSAGDWRTYTLRFGWRLLHAFPSMLSSYDAVDAGWMRMKTKGAEYILQLWYAQMAKLLLILLLKLFLWWTSPRISSEGHLLLCFPDLRKCGVGRTVESPLDLSYQLSLRMPSSCPRWLLWYCQDNPCGLYS